MPPKFLASFSYCLLFLQLDTEYIETFDQVLGLATCKICQSLCGDLDNFILCSKKNFLTGKGRQSGGLKRDIM